MRLFVALDLSPEVKNRLLAAAGVLRAQGRGNFTRPENLHLTLAFIGETERVEDAVAALREVQAPPLTLTVAKLGRFGDLWWAGAVPSPALTALQRQVSDRLRERGFVLERRAFKPHLTLCRAFRPAGAMDMAAVERALGRSSCRVDRVRLMQSHRPEGRLTYTEVASVLLK